MSQLPLLTEAERQQMLFAWNATQADYPNGKCIHQLFEEKVQELPTALAVIYEEGQLPYRELNRQANQLAHHLQRYSVGPEVRVGICMERTKDLVVGILGILKAGGAYVPIDPAYPHQRLAFMLEDAQVSILLTQEHLLSLLPAMRTPIICLDTSTEEIVRSSAENLVSGACASNLAYVIYTSGSTGRPKGIAIQHESVLNNMFDLNTRFNVGARDRVLSLSSLSFDMCVYETLGMLIVGAAVVIPNISKAQDPGHWAELMMQHRVTLWNSAPALLKMYVEYITDRPELHPHFLRLALLGGDWIPVTLPDQLKALAEDVQVISLGGATESSIHSTIYPIERSDPTWRSIPYGRPMANQSAYILDSELQLVPMGIPGELYLGGIGLARGYFNQPVQTAERFIPHPFAGQAQGTFPTVESGSGQAQRLETSPDPTFPTIKSGERLYKTGDLARYLPDGNIELLGRTDFQVKIRGRRIELGEITLALRKHPAIQDAVILAQGENTRDKRLVAYIVTKDGGQAQAGGDKGQSQDTVPTPPQVSLNTTALRNFLKKTLPEYMIPAFFVVLDALPLTPNGKVDRLALPTPDMSKPDLQESFVPPRTPVEEVLTGIWADVLGFEQVGVYDNFFELGGDSLLATSIITQIQEDFQIELSFRTFFEVPTVAGLAEALIASDSATGQNVIKIAQILLQLHQLSDVEVKAMLAQQSEE